MNTDNTAAWLAQAELLEAERMNAIANAPKEKLRGPSKPERQRTSWWILPVTVLGVPAWALILKLVEVW